MTRYMQQQKGDFLITTDPARMDVAAIHDFLANHSGWSDNIPFERVKRSMEHSLNFGVFHNNRQIGFARVISDFATVAYLGDVYLLEAFRGQGLSRWLMDVIMQHPDLQGLRRWILITSTAEWLYKKYGFTALSHPEYYLEKHHPDIYRD